MSEGAIAIVGAACRYPDASTPNGLWENVLACRRAFRRLPDVRLRLRDYWSDDRAAADVTYGRYAAVLEGYRFDRIRFRASATTYRSADLAHWLALEVASEALADAGFSGGAGLPASSTGVIVGNTLTGEFSRAATLRLRWPYVRRVIDATLEQHGHTSEMRAEWLMRFEAAFKAPFPPVDGETLAGGLSNTIAGRICNYFNLNGGGFVVDGACASSLLAVAQACSALTAGDLDVAVVGGVDLSLDPFELVGFAKAGALASDDMRVYDAEPTGFWPGEGCGFVVLMRDADARADRRRVYALIRGWGISSDGSGGMTRPEVDGQLLALARAYRRAGFGIDTVPLFEGHGTGTAVGDATELKALSVARRGARADAPPAALGSIKANIGHTKAAAGAAGLLKAAWAVYHHTIPPTTGCRVPHPILRGSESTLRIADTPSAWPEAAHLRAGVSAMGFGGINVHVVLEGAEARVDRPARGRRMYARTPQDSELFLLAASDAADLRDQLNELIAAAPSLSLSELTDLAVAQQLALADAPLRVALVARTPEEFERLLRSARDAVATGATLWDPESGVFVERRLPMIRLGYLFTGQGAPVRTHGGAWARAFEEAEAVYSAAALPEHGSAEDTAVAQPAIVASSCAALHVLDSLGIDAEVAIGHSLGELSALRWGGALSDRQAIGLARIRGRLMTDLADGPGAMAVLSAPRAVVDQLVVRTAAVIAALNGPESIVVSGPAAEVGTVLERAAERGIPGSRLRVAFAFHSALMRPVAPALRRVLDEKPLAPVSRCVISTVTAAPLEASTDLSQLLEDQLTMPVRFQDALSAAGPVDLFLEVGPGRSLAALAAMCGHGRVLTVDAGAGSLRPLLIALAGAFVLGAPLAARTLAARRFARPFDLGRPREFLVNPCELAAEAADAARVLPVSAVAAAAEAPEDATPIDTPAGDTCELLRNLVARRTELPIVAVEPSSRFLSDLHMNSMMVGELLAEATRRLGVTSLSAPTDYADASLEEAARALDQIRMTGASPETVPDRVDGADVWVRAFEIRDEEQALPPRRVRERGPWRIVCSPDHPLAAALESTFRDETGGPGTIVCMDPGTDPPVTKLLEAAQSAIRDRRAGRFVLVQDRPASGAFARTLFLESGVLDVAVVTVNFTDPRAAERVLDEACAARAFTEVRYDGDGRRLVPIAHASLGDWSREEVRLGPEDVLLVTGGARGIGAECALALARDTGVRLALIGRSQPEHPDVASQLERFRAHGVAVRYVQSDVIDARAVRRAIGDIRGTFGEVSAVLHAAGRNDPALIAALDEEQIAAALQPKVAGARNLLDALRMDRVKFFVAFGSVIARTGLAGEAHYGLANERLRELMAKAAAESSGCRCLTIEWSVWSAAGMGERLGRVDALARAGVTPIDIAGGVRWLKRVLASARECSSVVVAGRLGKRSTIQLARADLPFRRFLDLPRINIRDVELIADAELSQVNDPYLHDHRLDGQLVFPAVMGLEAMVQAAQALVRTEERPVLEHVEFSRAIIPAVDRAVVLRTAALRYEDGTVGVSLRTDTTEFQADHFRARCRWERSAEVPDGYAPVPSEPAVPEVQPARELYGSLLFQSGRFANLLGYRHLSATGCDAVIEATASSWFGPHLPETLVLGDAGVRDAAIHSVQACIPHRRVLPTAVDRIRMLRPIGTPCRVIARQREEHGDDLVWDLLLVDDRGAPLESWEGIRLRALGVLRMIGMPPELLGPYVERRLPSLGHRALPRVVLMDANGDGARAASDRALARILSPGIRVVRRPDGKPEVGNGAGISTAHAGALVMAVAAAGAVGCDLEPVRERPADAWRDLLGRERSSLGDVIARERDEPASRSATRVWAAVESLKKAGAPDGMPLLLDRAFADGWVTLRAGPYAVSTWVTERDAAALAVAVATGNADERV